MEGGEGLWSAHGSPWVQTYKLLQLVIKSHDERQREEMRGRCQEWRRGEGGGAREEEQWGKKLDKGNGMKTKQKVDREKR